MLSFCPPVNITELEAACILVTLREVVGLGKDAPANKEEIQKLPQSLAWMI